MSTGYPEDIYLDYPPIKFNEDGTYEIRGTIYRKEVDPACRICVFNGDSPAHIKECWARHEDICGIEDRFVNILKQKIL